MSGKNQYVVRNGDGWGVRGEGNGRLTKSFDTQREAIQHGRDIAMNQKAELRIQGTDARFREAWSWKRSASAEGLRSSLRRSRRDSAPSVLPEDG